MESGCSQGCHHLRLEHEGGDYCRDDVWVNETITKETIIVTRKDSLSSPSGGVETCNASVLWLAVSSTMYWDEKPFAVWKMKRESKQTDVLVTKTSGLFVCFFLPHTPEQQLCLQIIKAEPVLWLYGHLLHPKFQLLPSSSRFKYLPVKTHTFSAITWAVKYLYFYLCM